MNQKTMLLVGLVAVWYFFLRKPPRPIGVYSPGAPVGRNEID